MTVRRVCVLTVCLMLLFVSPVCAQTDDLYNEQLSASGADELVERLPADTQELLDELGLGDLQKASFDALSLSAVMGTMATLLRENMSGPLQMLMSLMAVVVLSALFSGLEGVTEHPALRQTYHTVSVLASSGLLLTSFSALLEKVEQAVDSVSVFMLSYVPVYGAIVAASGTPSAALSYQTTLLAAAELFTQGIRLIALPVLTVSLAFGCVGSVTEDFSLSSFSQTFYKAVLWAIGLFSTVFSGVLSVQQMVSAAGDSLGGRALRFSLASFVPVVGGMLSEAYATVVGCTGLLRSTVGGFGLVATVLIILPPLFTCIGWSVCLSLGGSAAALFKLSALEKLLRCIAGAVRVLIAVLAVFALLMLVSTSVIAYTGRS